MRPPVHEHRFARGYTLLIDEPVISSDLPAEMRFSPSPLLRACRKVTSP
ncbi:MAG: hypothetical protein KY456_10860 [Chloroflexi bacterium]|nr:hypothetical protein [Chloroflexota bacterium]